MPRPRATLTIEGETHAVRKATIGLHIAGEVWDARSKSSRYEPRPADVTYGLEVEVDDRSGEDGAPAPQIQSLPVLRAAGGRHPSLARLGELVVQELDDGYDCDEWDAWFGNDAPGLCGNRVVFQGWEGNALRVRWEARYDQGGRSRPFLFEGLVDFTGIYVRVKEAEDADIFLKGAWGAQDPGTLDKHVLGWTDHGAEMTADRRFSFAAIYTRKGEPLPEGYHVGALTKAAATAEREARQARFAAASAARAIPRMPPAANPHGESGPARRLFEGRKRFSLDAPGDWADVSAQDQVIARLGGISLRRGVSPSEEHLKILAVEMLIADDIAEYADTSTGAYASIWKVEERAEVRLSGARAERLVIEQKIGDVTTRLLKYFVALPGKSVAVMTFAAPAPVFASRLDAYEAIVRTLVVAP
ncbi:MAG: hypothetical protein K1Y01_18370 [Vicinamibacteria bacterium]|nr:hypothetical protein [Vicinamibacteria bacterium]